MKFWVLTLGKKNPPPQNFSGRPPKKCCGFPKKKKRGRQNISRAGKKKKPNTGKNPQNEKSLWEFFISSSGNQKSIFFFLPRGNFF